MRFRSVPMCRHVEAANYCDMQTFSVSVCMSQTYQARAVRCRPNALRGNRSGCDRRTFARAFAGARPSRGRIYLKLR